MSSFTGSTTASRAPIAMVIGSCLSLQVGAAVAAQLFAVAGSTGTTLLRLGTAAAVLLILVRPDVRAWQRHQWRSVMLLGVCLALMNGTFYAAIARIPLGVAVTIEFLGPLALAACLSRRPREWLWVALALTGVILLGVGETGVGVGLDPAGVALAAVAGVFWALYILATTAVGAAVPGQAGLAVATAAGAALLVPLGAGGAAAALARPESLLLALGAGVLASVIPYSLEMTALRQLPPRTFGVLLSMEPAIAGVIGWLLLGQHVGALAGVGIVVVVVASVGSTRTTRGEAPAAAEPQAGLQGAGVPALSG